VAITEARPGEYSGDRRRGYSPAKGPTMRKHLRNSKKGFTLIELMIVVAIIGILAAIAIPNFLRFQLRARSSEGKTNIAALRTAQESYQAEFGSYVSTDKVPPVIGSQKVVFDASADDSIGGFEATGWSPEGRVFFSYAMSANAIGTNYTVDAIANIDGDVNDQLWGYMKPDQNDVVIDGKYGCVEANDAVPTLVATTVGPCSLGSGASIF
jgi:type IV pilus assembly protein PilA